MMRAFSWAEDNISLWVITLNEASMRREHSPYVMVVEDDPVLREIYKNIVQSLDLEYIACENSDTVIETYKSFGPSIVLMDVEIPGSNLDINGIELTRKIKSLPGAENTVILVVSSHDNSEFINQAFAAGATDYTIKPVNITLLQNQLRHWYLFNDTLSEYNRLDRDFETLFNHIRTGLIILDAELHVRRVNAEWQQLTGFDELELFGRHYHDLFDEQTANNDREEMQDLLAGKIEGYVVDKKLRCDNGATIPIQLSIALTHTDEGMPFSFIVMIKAPHIST